MAIPAFGTLGAFGVYFDSGNSAYVFGSDRHGPWFQDWYGPWKGRRHGQRKGCWEPRGVLHGWTAEIRWAFKRSSLHPTVGVSTGVVASWRPRPVGVLRTHFVYLLLSVHLSPNAAFVFRHCLRENLPLCFAAPFFGNCLFVLTVGVHPQLKNCILLGGSSHLVNG